VTRNGDFVPPRKWFQLSGLGPTHDLGVHNATIDVLERALLERAFMCVLKSGEVVPPLGSTFAAWREMDVYCKQLDKYNGRYWYPQTAVEVVDYYKGSKKALYERARQSLIASPVLTQKDSMSVVFAKFEKANLDKAPRCIQPRDPRYNLLVGKYIKQIEHRIYRSIAKVFNVVNVGDQPTVIKGYDAVKSADILLCKWGRFANPIAIGLDAVKFDMHVSVPGLRMEHGVYLRMFRNDPKLRRLLERQINNKGRGYCKDGKLKFQIDGIRFSGDLTTSVGNCTQMTALVWTWAVKAGVIVELANNGDDCVVILEREDEARFRCGLETWFAEKGFRMEVEPTVDCFESIEFCQSHPVWNGSNYIMCRSLPTVLIKDSMCLISLDTCKTFKKWCAAVGMCGGSMSSGVPVMQSFYRAFRRAGGDAMPSRAFIESIYKNTGQLERMGALSYSISEIEAKSRFSFWIAHGITPDVQIELEKYYDSYHITYEGLKEVSSVQIKDTNYIEIPQN